jgi:hypothetical protein
MKFLFIFLVVAFCSISFIENKKQQKEATGGNNSSVIENKRIPRLQFKGLYESEKIEKRPNDPYGYWECFRFYQNSFVLEGGSMDDPNKPILRDLGNYLIHGDSIFFEITSDEGKVRYDGIILSNGNLKLNWHSFINGRESTREYRYVNRNYQDTIYIVPEIIDPCDSTKMLGFITNFNITDTILVGDSYEKKAIKSGNLFIKETCKKDTLFCDPVFLFKKVKYTCNEYTAYSFAFRRIGDNTYESGSSSFYIIQVYKNQKLIFKHIFEDLMGEIIVELKGIKEYNGRLTIYGAEYPYFVPDYGRFILTYEEGKFNIVHECREIH